MWCRIVTAVVLVVALAGCRGEGPDGSATESSASAATPQRGSTGPTSGGSQGSAQPDDVTVPEGTVDEGQARAAPVSLLGLAEQHHQGDRLRLGAVRERTPAFTSYDVTYRSRSTTRRGTESFTISGVLNVPRGRGPFPAVVLAHGYIDPAIYVRGQGMTRERGYLAARGYVALHVDYRNHAESDDDPRLHVRMRLGYSADVINAAKALGTSPDVAVDADRIALFGRSMGGGVILKALVAEPNLVQAAAPWASVSSLERENYDQFIRSDPDNSGLRDRLARREGTPEQDPALWRRNSSRPYFDRIAEPVLLVHGRFDDTCPPRWARATQQALTHAGVTSRLEWYDDGHAFGPAFNAAMNETVRFFNRHLR